MVSPHRLSRTLHRGTPALAVLAVLFTSACGGKGAAPGEPLPAEVTAASEATADAAPVLVEAPLPVAPAEDVAVALAPDAAGAPAVAPEDETPPTVKGIRITEDGIIGPGFMITGDGIIAPGVEITKKHLKVVITGDVPELEGLRDRLSELGPLIRAVVESHAHGGEDGRLQVGAVAITLGEDGAIDLDIDDNGSLDLDLDLDLDLEGLAKRVGAVDGAKLSKLMALARALDGDDHVGAPGPGKGSKRFTCAAGECAMVCPAGETCRSSCAGGGCRQTCQAGASCRLSCAGGDCHQRCEDGAICKLSCAGGGCRRECAKDARCEMSCLGDDCSTAAPR